MSYLDDLKAREEKAEEDLRRLEEAEEIAKNIANLERARHSKAGTIKRMVSTFGALSPVDAIYKANEASLKRSDAGKATAAFARSFAKSYADSIANNAKTAWTGRDYTTQQKTYSDIIEKQMGMQKGGASTALGVVGDIATDPLNFIGTPAFKVVSKTAGFIGKEMTALAAKAPQIEKGMDALARQFNIFHDIEKSFTKSSVDKFKDAFRVAAESRNFTKLANLGFDVSNYTKRVFDPSLQKIIPPKFINVLDEAFGPQIQPGMTGKVVGGSLDFTSNVFKRLMSWSPKFQTRNFMGAVTQGLSEMPMSTMSQVGGVGKNYYNALKMVMSKGKSDPKTWSQAKEYGLTKSTGMFEQSMDRIPAKIANFGESVNRIALLLSEKASGKSLAAAVEKTQDVFYKYNKAYLTGTEKTIMSRIFPFYQFFKGQIQYWPEALGRNAAKWTGLGRIKEGTKSDTERESPFLTPDYWKDMFSVKTVGNIGFQLEDFLKNATGDVKNMWGQLQPLMKGTFELVTDWKVFQGKKLSTDTSGKGYDKLGAIVGGALYGYNPNTKTVNPYNKWLIDSIAGPIMGPIKALTDSNKSFIDSLLGATTSIRDYNLAPKALSRQQLMQNAEDSKGGFWGNIARRFGGNVGPSSATAAVPVKIVAGTGFKKDIAEWEATYGGGVAGSFGTVRNPNDVGNAQDLEYRSRQTMLQNVIKIAADATNDIGVNAENVHKLELRQIYEKYKYEGKLGTQQHKQEMEWAKAKYRTTAPRTYGQDPYLDIATRDKYRRSPGNSAINQFRNKALDEFVAERSKIMELNRSLVVTSPESLQRERDADLKGLELKYKTQYGYMSKKDYEDHAKAIVEKYGRAVADLEAKGKTAMATLLEQWAKSEINSFQKIELERQAAKNKFQGTDDYRRAEAAKNYQYIKSMEEALDKEYDQKRRDLMVKEAKAHMETVKAMTKGKADDIVQALNDIYKRGGKSIAQYYGEVLKARTDQYTKEAIEALKVAKALLGSGKQQIPAPTEPTALGSQKLSNYDITTEFVPGIRGEVASRTMRRVLMVKIEQAKAQCETLDQFTNAFNEIVSGHKFGIDFKIKPKSAAPVDPANVAEIVKANSEIETVVRQIAKIQDEFEKGHVDPKVAVEKITAAYEKLTSLTGGVDVVGLETAIKSLADVANKIQHEVTSEAAGIASDTVTFNKAVSQINEESSKLRAGIYGQNSISIPGVRSITGNAVRWGQSTSPYAPKGYDVNKLALEEAQKIDSENAVQRFRKVDQTYRATDVNLPLQKEQESTADYIVRIQDALQGFENRKVAISEAGKTKLKALQQADVDFTITAANTKLKAEETVAQKRMSVASGMSGMLLQTSELLYQMAGEDSKEAFYAMKAIAIVDATIKGAQAVMSAYLAGLSVGGPAAPATASAYAGIAAALASAQISLITASMINGPQKKAEGGPITGGSGRKDDVLMWGMGGEYIIKKSSTQKYGAAFLDALNRGLIPVSDLQFSIPSMPVPNYGQTHFADGGLVGVHKPTPVTVELKNESGTPLKQTKSDVNFNGQEYVVTVWLDALERNVGGLRSALGG